MFKSFIDESSAKRPPHHQEYLVCAAVLPIDDLDDIRNHLKPLLLPGQIKLHWTDESDSRRKKIVDAISEISQFNAVITHLSETAKKTERFRRKCLEQLYYDLLAEGVTDHLLESRTPTQNQEDIKHLLALKNQGLNHSIRINHARGGDDPLLWIPDVILGAVNSAALGNHGYYETLEDTIAIKKKTPTSL